MSREDWSVPWRVAPRITSKDEERTDAGEEVKGQQQQIRCGTRREVKKAKAAMKGQAEGASRSSRVPASHWPGLCNTDIRIVAILKCVIPVILHYSQPHKGSHHLGHTISPLRPPRAPYTSTTTPPTSPMPQHWHNLPAWATSRYVFLHITPCTKIRTYERDTLNPDHNHEMDRMISVLPT